MRTWNTRASVGRSNCWWLGIAAIVLVFAPGHTWIASAADETAAPRARQEVHPPIDPKLPTLWIIGDSTVRNGQDNGNNGQWGWGNPIASFFDTKRINVCSTIPRNKWNEGKVSRDTTSYTKWAEEAAKQAGAEFINLNHLVADRYDAAGEEKVTQEYFPEKETTHPDWAGAVLNAECV